MERHTTPQLRIFVSCLYAYFMFDPTEKTLADLLLTKRKLFYNAIVITYSVTPDRK